MNTKMIVIVGAVIVALYLVFSRKGPNGATTQLNLGGSGIPVGSSPAGALAGSISSLGSSIARALSGGSALPGGAPQPPPSTITPAAAAGTGASSPDLAVGSYYAQATGNESLEEPTWAPNSNSFTIVGTGPAPIAAPNVTPSVPPTPGVLAFLNPNGNIPPPAPVYDAGSGNYSTGSAAVGSSPTNYGATGVSLDSDVFGFNAADVSLGGLYT